MLKKVVICHFGCVVIDCCLLLLGIDNLAVESLLFDIVWSAWLNGELNWLFIE